MEYTTIEASVPGMPAPKITKRPADSKIFQIDCSTLLSKNDLISGEVEFNVSNVDITEVKTSYGKFIRFRVTGGTLTNNVPYMDNNVVFIVKTIGKNLLSIPITIRVYAN